MGRKKDKARGVDKAHQGEKQSGQRQRKFKPAKNPKPKKF
jgi:hypothetical protein